jgi:glycosyltransferase involved in cell wall biosynthesis
MGSSLLSGQAKICILTSGHSPFDERIFHKEAKSLAKAGYRVVIVAQHDTEQVVDGVKILPVPATKSRFERMTRTTWRLFRLALKEKARIYHFHEPALIPAGIVLKLLGKQVIYDMHELVFHSFDDKSWLGPRFFKKLAQLIYLLIEGASVRTLDHLVLAEDDYQTYYNLRYRTFSNYTIVRNYPILSLIENTPPPDRIYKPKPIVIYAGGLERVRGTREIIQAMELLRNKAELWLLGKWESQKFKKECEDLRGWKYTRYLGFVPLSEAYQHMKIADVGIAMLYPIRNYLTSLPVKAFEYMACSLPMVASNFPYWQGIFGECALFANPYKPEDIANKILYLLDDPDKAKQLGKRGRQLTEEQYNWEAESKKLVALYEKLLK